jgi:predicted amidohydrolase YtcJ
MGTFCPVTKKQKKYPPPTGSCMSGKKRLPPEISFRTPASWRADTYICMLIRDIAARALGVSSQTGSLEVGKDADLVLLDESFTGRLTVVRRNRFFQIVKW